MKMLPFARELTWQLHRRDFSSVEGLIAHAVLRRLLPERVGEALRENLRTAFEAGVALNSEHLALEMDRLLAAQRAYAASADGLQADPAGWSYADEPGLKH